MSGFGSWTPRALTQVCVHQELFYSRGGGGGSAADPEAVSDLCSILKVML
jgi:hypothetical protein